MRKLILFYGHSGDDDLDYGTVKRQDSLDGLQTNLIAQYYDCSDSPIPDEGYRVSEYKKSDVNGRPTTTHHRYAPWKVSKVESYVPDLPTGTDFGEVVVCTCEYEPLPDDDNPWIEIVNLKQKQQVTFDDSFGGDKDLFVTFLTESDVSGFELRGRIPVEFKDVIETSGIALG